MKNVSPLNGWMVLPHRLRRGPEAFAGHKNGLYAKTPKRSLHSGQGSILQTGLQAGNEAQRAACQKAGKTVQVAGGITMTAQLFCKRQLRREL